MGGSVPQIPGSKISGDKLRALRQEVAKLLQRSSTNFPGAQPVSFAAHHKFELQKQDYYVCEKSDGIRCLMYQTEDETTNHEAVYLIDRKNDYYLVPELHFPLPDKDVTSYHVKTLVDGELVNDRLPNETMQLTYLVFDCLCLNGNSALMHRTLDKRLAYFRENVFNPYKALYKKYPEEIQFLPFIVDFKKMELGYGIEMMFRDVLPNLRHGNDGLIFTCRNTPYQFGTDSHILKWKPPEENSIDFLLKLEFPTVQPDAEDLNDGFTDPYSDYSAIPKCKLLVSEGEGKYLHWADMFIEDAEWETLVNLDEPLNDRVTECFKDGRGRWRFLRFRDDKTEANHISTVKSVIESIEDRVTKEDLIGAAKRIRDEWKKREALGAAADATSRNNNVPQAQSDATRSSRQENGGT